MKAYYFTIGETAENVGEDHHGNIKGARTKAQALANEYRTEIVINSFDDEIVDFIYPEKSVEEKKTKWKIQIRR